MKRNSSFTCLIIACLMLANLSVAQNRQGVGIHFGAYDFYGPQNDTYWLSNQNHYSYNDTKGVYDTTIRKSLKWNPMVRVTYWFQASKNFDISLGLSLASLDYPNDIHDSEYVTTYRNNVSGVRHDKFLAELDVRFNYNILEKERYIVSPYLFAGLNGAYHNIFFGADIPLGLGLNFNLTHSHNLFFNLESAYKIAATAHDVNHLQHSAGLIFWFKPGYRKPQTQTQSIPDTIATQSHIIDSDGDGIPDNEDACPTVAGTAQFNGCPDSDGDGIPDRDDACPLVAGLAQFNGCPDSDGDGIPDNKDKCPYAAGPADRQGCPVPDRDGDGFTDDVDKCPDVYSKTNGGCPEIRKEIITQVENAAKAIFFETGKATIKKVSFKSLDAVVAVLKSDATLYADIEGHTDNVQPKTYTNMELSQKRAEAVRDYFVSKGVDAGRLTAQGFGDTQPVADNATAAGKAQNRRTVIKLRNYAK